MKIYTTDYCGFCSRAKALLNEKKIPFEEIDVSSDDGLRSQLVEMSGGQKTVPQIFIGETHVGGYTDLAALDRSGKLTEMLA